MTRACASCRVRCSRASPWKRWATLHSLGNFTFPTRPFPPFPLPLPFCKLDTASGHGCLIAGRLCGRGNSWGERDSVTREMSTSFVETARNLTLSAAQHCVGDEGGGGTKWTRRVPHPVLIGHAASLGLAGRDCGAAPARAGQHRGRTPPQPPFPFRKRRGRACAVRRA